MRNATDYGNTNSNTTVKDFPNTNETEPLPPVVPPSIAPNNSTWKNIDPLKTNETKTVAPTIPPFVFPPKNYTGNNGTVPIEPHVPLLTEFPMTNGTLQTKASPLTSPPTLLQTSPTMLLLTKAPELPPASLPTFRTVSTTEWTKEGHPETRPASTKTSPPASTKKSTKTPPRTSTKASPVVSSLATPPTQTQPLSSTTKQDTQPTKITSTKSTDSEESPYPFPPFQATLPPPQNNTTALIFALGITVGIIIITIAGFCFFFFCVYRKEQEKRRIYVEHGAAFSGSGPVNFRFVKKSPKRVQQTKTLKRPRQYQNPDLAPSYIEPEKFVHKGHLVVDKYQEPEYRHALEDQTPSTNDANAKVSWQSKHEVVDFGENVEEVISNRSQNKSKTRNSTMKSTAPGSSMLETGDTAATQSLGLPLDNVMKISGGNAKKKSGRSLRK